MTRETADVVVVGCGGFGSSVVCHLARRGINVVGIDQFSPPHNFGSSHGHTRVTRKAYFEHPDYVPLLNHSAEWWRELQQFSGTELFVRCGLLLVGPSDGEVIHGTRLAQQQHQLDIASLTVNEARQRFPQFRFPPDADVLFESDSGYLWSERCIAAHLKLAENHGARLLANETVTGLETAEQGVTVTTQNRVISAATAVMTAGAWTGHLLKDYRPLIRVCRKTLFWYPQNAPVWSDPLCPIHFFDLPTGQFYGFPSVDHQTVKVAEHTGGEFVSAVGELRREIAGTEADPVSQYVGQHLTSVSPVHSASCVCMYSMSPDGHFLLDHLPSQSLVVAAGFSGHGFKFTGVLGQAVSDLICDGRTELPIEFLSASRLR